MGCYVTSGELRVTPGCYGLLFVRATKERDTPPDIVRARRDQTASRDSLSRRNPHVCVNVIIDIVYG